MHNTMGRIKCVLDLRLLTRPINNSKNIKNKPSNNHNQLVFKYNGRWSVSSNVEWWSQWPDLCYVIKHPDGWEVFNYIKHIVLFIIYHVYNYYCYVFTLNYNYQAKFNHKMLPLDDVPLGSVPPMIISWLVLILRTVTAAAWRETFLSGDGFYFHFAFILLSFCFQYVLEFFHTKNHLCQITSRPTGLNRIRFVQSAERNVEFLQCRLVDVVYQYAVS